MMEVDAGADASHKRIFGTDETTPTTPTSTSIAVLIAPAPLNPTKQNKRAKFDSNDGGGPVPVLVPVSNQTAIHASTSLTPEMSWRRALASRDRRRFDLELLHVNAADTGNVVSSGLSLIDYHTRMTILLRMESNRTGQGRGRLHPAPYPEGAGPNVTESHDASLSHALNIYACTDRRRRQTQCHLLVSTRCGPTDFGVFGVPVPLLVQVLLPYQYWYGESDPHAAIA